MINWTFQLWLLGSQNFNFWILWWNINICSFLHLNLSVFNVFFFCNMRFGHLVVLHILCLKVGSTNVFFFHLHESLFRVDLNSFSMQQFNQITHDFTDMNINEPWVPQLCPLKFWEVRWVQSVKDCSQLVFLVQNFKVNSSLINTALQWKNTFTTMNR